MHMNAKVALQGWSFQPQAAGPLPPYCVPLVPLVAYFSRKSADPQKPRSLGSSLVFLRGSQQSDKP